MDCGKRNGGKWFFIIFRNKKVIKNVKNLKFTYNNCAVQYFDTGLLCPIYLTLYMFQTLNIIISELPLIMKIFSLCELRKLHITTFLNAFSTKRIRFLKYILSTK